MASASDASGLTICLGPPSTASDIADIAGRKTPSRIKQCGAALPTRARMERMAMAETMVSREDADVLRNGVKRLVDDFERLGYERSTIGGPRCWIDAG